MFIFFVVLKDYPHASLYKDSHDRNPLIGGIAKALGGMGLDRENDFKAAETIIKVIKGQIRGKLYDLSGRNAFPGTESVAV